MMEGSCSAECFVTDSVTCGYQTSSGRKQRNYPVQCVTAWHAANVGLSYPAILVTFSNVHLKSHSIQNLYNVTRESIVAQLI